MNESINGMVVIVQNSHEKSNKMLHTSFSLIHLHMSSVARHTTFGYAEAFSLKFIIYVSSVLALFATFNRKAWAALFENKIILDFIDKFTWPFHFLLLHVIQLEHLLFLLCNSQLDFS